MEYPKWITTPAGERLIVNSREDEDAAMAEATGVHAEDKTVKPRAPKPDLQPGQQSKARL